MAVSVPGVKPQDTRSTATWPPNRTVSPRVSSAGGWGSACGTTGSALVADRDRHPVGRDRLDQREQIVRVLAVGLDLEVVHHLERLVVLLAESHRALRRVEGQPLHGGDEL